MSEETEKEAPVKKKIRLSYSENVPELLHKLNCSIAISTYQAGKLIFLTAITPNKITQIPKSYKKPMGIAIDGNRLAIATLNYVEVLKNVPELARSFPMRPGLYDSMFLPRASYYSGLLDLHDLHWTNQGLIAVNTMFSCISRIDQEYSFTPLWQPPFISELRPEDRCHLNGLAVKDGEPMYVSALGTNDYKDSWRENIATDGVVMHIPTSKIILDGLPMPHSPRVYGDDLYVLLSATGQLLIHNLITGKEKIMDLPGFVRGMCEYNEYIFIGLSQIRKGSKSFNKLPVKEKAEKAGVIIIFKPTSSIIGHLTYDEGVEEIYDVQVIPGVRVPGILSAENEIHLSSIAAPGMNYWKKERKQEKESENN
ncbi:MAG: TIGR03032 family protein [Bacteroidia bacterium]